MGYSASFSVLFSYFNLFNNLCRIVLTSLLCSLDWLHPHNLFLSVNCLRYFKKINDRPGLCTSKATFNKRVSRQKFGEKASANFGLPVASGPARSRLLPLTASDTIKKPNGTNLHFARARSCLSKLNTSLRRLAEMNFT